MCYALLRKKALYLFEYIFTVVCEFAGLYVKWCCVSPHLALGVQTTVPMNKTQF